MWGNDSAVEVYFQTNKGSVVFYDLANGVGIGVAYWQQFCSKKTSQNFVPGANEGVGPVDGNYRDVFYDMTDERPFLRKGEGNVGFAEKLGCGLQREGEFVRGENAK